MGIIDLTFVQICAKIQPTAASASHVIAISVSETNMPYIPNI